MASPNSKYDWGTWFKRTKFVLRQGRQYICSQANMVQQVRNEAHKRGRKASVRDLGDRIEVTLHGKSVRRKYVTVGK